jgi:hypothetical protein
MQPPILIMEYLVKAILHQDRLGNLPSIGSIGSINMKSMSFAINL